MSLAMGREPEMAAGSCGDRKCKMSRAAARPMKAMGKWTAAGWMGFLSGFLGSVEFLLASMLAGCGTGAGLRLALSSSESRDLERGRDGSADMYVVKRRVVVFIREDRDEK